MSPLYLLCTLQLSAPPIGPTLPFVPPAPVSPDQVAATYYAGDSVHLPQVFTALAQSATGSIALATWRLSDGTLAQALCAAAAGLNRSDGYAITTAANNGTSATLVNAADPYPPWMYPGVISFSATDTNGATYGPWPYNTSTDLAMPPGVIVRYDVNPDYGFLIANQDADGNDHATAIAAICAAAPLTAVLSVSQPGLSVSAALNITGGTWTGPQSFDGYQYLLASNLVHAGVTVYNTKIPRQIQNNFLLLDSGTCTRGNYYMSPTAIQAGAYCQIITGTNQAAADRAQFEALCLAGSRMQNLPPEITSLTPPSGTAAGGTTVIIAGFNMSGSTAVLFGTTPALAYSCSSNWLMSAVSPPGTGTVNIRIVSPYGISATSTVSQFVYSASAAHNPSLRSYSPPPQRRVPPAQKTKKARRLQLQPTDLYLPAYHPRLFRFRPRWCR